MDLKSKLQEVEQKLARLRDEKKSRVDAREEAKKVLAEQETIDADSEEFKAADEATKAVRETEAQIAKAQDEQVGILRMLGEDDPDPFPDAGQPAKAKGWDSQRILAGDKYRELAASDVIHSEKAKIGNVVLGEIVGRDELPHEMRADVGSSDVAGLIQPDHRGLVTPTYRPLTLLDLIPSGTTDSNSLEYVQVTTRATAAEVQEEGEPKAEQTLAFEDADAPIRTIAGFIKVRKQTLADAPGLRTFIDAELRYDVRRVLEEQVIDGNGQGQNLTGLLRTTGILEPSVSGYNSYADRVHRGITVLSKANYMADAVVLNPDDWEVIRLSRDDSGAQAGTGGYLFGLPAFPGLPTLWGLTPVISQSIPQGTALVGAFRRGAVIMYRQGMTLLVSDSDQDDFTRNRVTILAELRAGMPVFRPDAFALIDLEGGS